MNFLSSTQISPERARRARQQREAKRFAATGTAHQPQGSSKAATGSGDTPRGARPSRYDEGSPSSSDFELLSDVEVTLNKPAPLPSRPSSLSHEYPRSPSGRSRERSASGEGEQELGRGVEGDDEDSSAFEDGADDARGRGRTRERRRDPELKRSMLEEALRSSLSTILSLTPAHAGMSQTPAMSHVSLASLLSSPRYMPPTPTTSRLTASRPFPPAQRLSPFASSLSGPYEEDDEENDDGYEQAPEAVRRGNESQPHDVLSASSEGSDSEAEQTELSPRPSQSSQAIPIPRSQSRSYPEARSAFPPLSRETDEFFPSHLQPSRPLGSASAYPDFPTSDSPPVYSRRRGSRRDRGFGTVPVRGRGRGSSASPGPGPASLEERRRARMSAPQGHRAVERGGTTDVEDESVERDEAFAELVSAARFFSDLSPRASTTRSLPASFDSARTTRPPPPPLYPPALSSTPPYSSGAEDDDPALASESVPTLEGLSSGAEGSRSPSSHPDRGREQPHGSKDGTGREAEKAPKAEHVGDEPSSGKANGWLGWFGIGKTVKLKVWHLVGLCGVLIGVGWGASTLIRSLVLAASPSPNSLSLVSSASNLSSSRFEFAPLPSRPPANGMSALFL
ncbi:hypothetical protein JCM10212_004884 [Sporobolomyces blumeae]